MVAKQQLATLKLVRELVFGLQPANFISSSVKIFAGSPAYDCKFCLAWNKICSLSAQNQFPNKLLMLPAKICTSGSLPRLPISMILFRPFTWCRFWLCYGLSRGRWMFFIDFLLTWVYRKVVFRSLWPSNSCMKRMSVPASRRWVAKLCRKLIAIGVDGVWTVWLELQGFDQAQEGGLINRSKM